MSDIIWEKLSENKRKKLTEKMGRLSVKFSKINYSKPAHTALVTKIKFDFCRLMQKKVFESGIAGIDNKYWNNNGWLGKKRPWKN